MTEQIIEAHELKVAGIISERENTEIKCGYFFSAWLNNISHVIKYLLVKQEYA